jgi:hypothetical protein
MSWRNTQQRMIEELNTKIFFDDPCRKIHEEYSSMDIENTNYIQELKNRERYGPHDFNGSLIEKKKYDFLVNQGKILNKIPGYVCRFNDNSYWAWNLKKLPEPNWYEKMLPDNTHFGNNTMIPKMIGDLTLKDGKKLI